MTNRPKIPAEVEREIFLECGHRCAICGTPFPLERAHIIPWHKSKEHKAEDLICLCANCHELADQGEWGKKTLREYKTRPWVVRQYKNPGDILGPTSKVKLTINMEVSHFDEKNQRWLQHAIAGFLEIPPDDVKITSIEKANSIKVTVELPTQSVESLLNAYERNDPELFKYLAPLVLLHVSGEAARPEPLQKEKKMASEFRPLSAEQIAQLTSQGCSSEDFSKVLVAEDFNADTVKSTHFCGQVKLGVFAKQVSFFGGVKKPAGISHATIHNCIIGNNVYISHVRNYIANYIIEDDVVIDNIDLLAVEGESSFGNGTEVAVVNEAGGREIAIYDHLSAHTAYIIAFYRHMPEVIEKLQKMIAGYTASVTCSMGVVGPGARLINCRIIKNTKIGPASVIEGVSRLENGSVNSCPEDPVYIGPGVFAEDFIVCSGSKITDGTIIYKCFVGQGTVLAKQYSAENSVFFANCGGFHGEACSVFAGPYTVTHHKSTLLISGLFSFLNAGSGTNQSNHMYKLGPTHQGIVERGSKTASDSYMLWPAKVGAFTVVMGRHYKNSDTSDLPFSYLIEHEDESILAPGVNLRSVGTVRDARKWPRRDKRKDPRKLDYINFKLLSPYTIQKMLNGCRLLANLKATSGQNTEYFTYNSVRIKNSALDRGIKLYQIGIDKFLGNCLIKRLENKQLESIDELREVLRPTTDSGPGKWVDLAGLFAPEADVKKMLCDIENGTINTLEQLTSAFQSMYDNYPANEWAWAANILQQHLGKTLDRVTADDIIELTAKWKTAVVELDRMIYADTKKEFAATVQIGYGLDGKKETKQADFQQVRGTFEENSFVLEIEKHIITKTALGDELISRMKKMASSE